MNGTWSGPLVKFFFFSISFFPSVVRPTRITLVLPNYWGKKKNRICHAAIGSHMRLIFRDNVPCEFPKRKQSLYGGESTGKLRPFGVNYALQSYWLKPIDGEIDHDRVQRLST